VKRPPFFSWWVEKSRYKIPCNYIRKLLPVFNWNKYGCTIFLKFQIVQNEISTHLKHCLGFSFVFSAPAAAWRNLFSASGISCSGRYQPGSTGIFWPAEGTSQLVTTSKKWKNPSSALRRKRTWVQALLLYFMHFFFQFNCFRIWCPPNLIGICSSSSGCFMPSFAWKEIPNHGWMDGYVHKSCGARF